jgi:diguanylate cyclase (GGDEF)-like protein
LAPRCRNLTIGKGLQGAVYVVNEAGGKGFELVLPERLGVVKIHFSDFSIRHVSPTLFFEVASNFAQTLRNALSHAQLKELAMKDGLTGLFNRRVFDELLEVEIRRRQLVPISLLIIDLDDFKKVNDTFGHQAGDHVLTTVGRILREGCRGSDLVARYGGEEFAVMLPATSTAVAFDIAQRLRSRIASTTFVFAGQHLKMTASIGLASTGGSGKDALTHLISRADQALYRAKKAGKNTTYVHAARTIELKPRASTHNQGRNLLRSTP